MAGRRRHLISTSAELILVRVEHVVALQDRGLILAVALRRKILGSRGREFSLRRLKVGHKRRIGMKPASVAAPIVGFDKLASVREERITDKIGPRDIREAGHAGLLENEGGRARSRSPASA
jgi:hypothetical protein